MECNGDSSNCVEAYSDGPGLEDTDLALYVYGVTFNCGGGTIAYAAACQLEDQYDRYDYLTWCVHMRQSFIFCRPISGVINFCPTDVNDEEQVFHVAKHEIFHVLVS